MKEVKDKALTLVQKTANFIKTDIWRIRTHNLPAMRAFLINQTRVVLLALRGFNEDKCQLRASALTFYSLLSIVPVAAMAFGIAKGFGFEKMLEQQIYQNLSGQEEVITQIITFANTLLENTKGGLVAGLGVAVLFWTVIKVLGNIEHSFNDIWGIKHPRTLLRKFSDYLSVMLICPILAIASSSITVFITTQVKMIAGQLALLEFIGPVIFSLLKMLPYCLFWVLFTFIYIFMPNTKVKFTSGLLAGIIAGTIYVIVQGAYIYFQVGVSRYNAIYGSFAALPLFLVWLQVSWLVVLFGAEISFAHQNVNTYEFEPDCLNASEFFKKMLSVRVSHLLVKNFAEGKEALTDAEISKILEVPIRLTRQILFDLESAGILTEVYAGEQKEAAYQPARDIDVMTIKYILEALSHRGTMEIPIAKDEEHAKLMAALKKFDDMVRSAPENKLLKEI